MVILFCITIIISFFVAMHLFSSSQTCFQYNVSCAWDYCESVCWEHYSAECRYPQLVAAWCMGDGYHTCINYFKAVCDNGRGFYHVCDAWDSMCE